MLLDKPRILDPTLNTLLPTNSRPQPACHSPSKSRQMPLSHAPAVSIPDPALPFCPPLQPPSSCRAPPSRGRRPYRAPRHRPYTPCSSSNNSPKQLGQESRHPRDLSILPHPQPVPIDPRYPLPLSLSRLPCRPCSLLPLSMLCLMRLIVLMLYVHLMIVQLFHDVDG